MIMQGKKGLVMGVANDRSISWGIAKKIASEGGQVAFTYQSDSLKKSTCDLIDILLHDLSPGFAHSLSANSF